MGVAGAGKSTVLAALADRLGWRTLDGDTLHPAASVAKMAAGRPLSEADRRPWLAAIAAWIRSAARAGESSIVACSALRRRHRDVLRTAGPRVMFVHLIAPPEVLAMRLTRRVGHFMPPDLLATQLATLEPLDAGTADVGFEVDATRRTTSIVREILDRAGLPGG